IMIVFFQLKTANEVRKRLVGLEMCLRERSFRLFTLFWSKISLISFKKEEKIYFLEPKIQK
ncbi:hypothetical protein, partial [Mesomycoplasma hyorhinis]|uniref:hypothetical protein n=1 Tax=Mesomycoplasma hyorhinis TaxID=2100 RepID=UPI001C04DC61